MKVSNEPWAMEDDVGEGRALGDDRKRDNDTVWNEP